MTEPDRKPDYLIMAPATRVIGLNPATATVEDCAIAIEMLADYSMTRSTYGSDYLLRPKITINADADDPFPVEVVFDDPRKQLASADEEDEHDLEEEAYETEYHEIGVLLGRLRAHADPKTCPGVQHGRFDISFRTLPALAESLNAWAQHLSHEGIEHSPQQYLHNIQHNHADARGRPR